MRLSTILLALTWGGIVIAGTMFFQALERSPNHAAENCTQPPELGTTSILDRAMTPIAGMNYGVLSVRNDQPYPLVAVLLDPDMTRKMQVVSVDAGSVAHVQVPAGQYGLGLMAGKTWCNLHHGFLDGTRHTINGGVEVKPSLMTQAVIAQGATPGDIDIRFRELYRTDEIQAGGLEARSGEKNVITTQGSVNGTPVSFVIDTGASTLTLPTDIARQARVRCVSSGQFVTATGATPGCRGVAKTVDFGPFRLYDVEVAILSGGESVLLGMNVLRRFTMVWRDDAVRITSVESEIELPQHAGDPGRGFAPIVPWAAF